MSAPPVCAHLDQVTIADVPTRAQGPSSAVRTVIVPRSPTAWIALSSRFVHTWLSSPP